MKKTVRFGVSLESDLLKDFDRLIRRKGYANRSEAIRDLIRSNLTTDEWESDSRETVGILGLVYDHEAHELTERLNTIQHDHLHLIVSSTHIHLDARNCLEVIIMRGQSLLIRQVSDRLLAAKSVKHGQLLTTTTGKHIH